MRKSGLSGLSPVFALLLAGCLSLPPADAPFDGVTYRRHPAPVGLPLAIHVLEIDLTRPGIALEVTPKDPSGGRQYRAQTTSEYVARHGLKAAVNGAFLEPFKGGTYGGNDYVPHSGDPVDATPGPKPNGTVCIKRPAAVSIEKGTRCASSTDEALTAGPMLVSGGEVQAFPGQQPRHPRTAFGLSADRKKAWMVVIDGRQPPWSVGATLAETAEILRDLGASEALNFDGGGSSTMVVSDGAGPRVVNSPMHTAVPGRERPVANHLGVRAR